MTFRFLALLHFEEFSVAADLIIVDLAFHGDNPGIDEMKFSSTFDQ